MVSLAIGLILMGGMVQIFKSNKNAYLYNASLAEMQDNGNYALEFVANQIGQIGFVPNWIGYTDADHNQDGYKDRRDLEFWAYGAKQPFDGKEGGGGDSDSIAINVFADPSDASAIDCVGNTVTSPGTFTGAPGFFGMTNTLAVVKDTVTGRFALTCNGVEVAEGVENMQIVYGVDTPDPGKAPPFNYDGHVDVYLKSNEINAADLMNIITVRISLLVASNEQSRTAENKRTYATAGDDLSVSGDRKLRNVYTTTIRLRNRCAKFSGSPLCA